MITNLAASVFHLGTELLSFGLVFPRVSKLRILNPVASTTSLMRFILTFSKTSDLEIQHPRWTRGDRDKNSSPLPCGRDNIVFDGSLVLVGLGGKFEEFTSLLAKQGMRFKIIRLLRCGFSCSSAMRDFSDAIRDTVAFLNVAPLWRGECVDKIGSDSYLLARAEQKWIPMEIPECESLKVLVLDMKGGVRVEEAANWINSITSTRLAVFVLDFGDRDIMCVRKAGPGSLLDKALCGLARRVNEETGGRLTMALAAKNPCELVAMLPEFRKVGNIWQGETVIGNTSGRRDHYWSFLAATESERQEADESVLDYLRV